MAGISKTKKRYMLYDSLTLKTKHADGWSKWVGRDGSLFVFKHLQPHERQKTMVGRVYKNRQYFSGLFKTREALEFSGDMRDPNTGERLFLVFDFSQPERVTILRRVS